MMKFTELDDEGEGLALAAFVLGFAMLTKMKAKGLLTTEDVRSILEAALSQMETPPASTHPGSPSARVLLDGLAQVLLRPKHEP